MDPNSPAGNELYWTSNPTDMNSPLLQTTEMVFRHSASPLPQPVRYFTPPIGGIPSPLPLPMAMPMTMGQLGPDPSRRVSEPIPASNAPHMVFQPQQQQLQHPLPNRRAESDRVKTKRKKLSLQEGNIGQSSSANKLGGSLRASPVQEDDLRDDQGEVGEHDPEEGGSSPQKGKRKSSGGSAATVGLISCEACRRGKRRCEPSPLVPPDHPDAAKLPCARCRRFATECIRVRTVKRKGPAKVDLSALSDAAHGFPPALTGESSIAGQHQSKLVDQRHFVPTASYDAQPRKSSSTSSHYVSPVPSTSLQPLESLDQFVSRPTLDKILQLFFHYVYPLTPCLHRPTFMADLAARRDLTDPIFFAVVLSVVASTLVQVPRNLVDMDKAEVERLARNCLQAAREKIAFLWEESIPPQSSMIVICYLLGIGYLILGNNTAHVVITAQANQLALALRLNEESSYDGLDPVEEQIRRRIFWLLFQADKSTACLRARTINLRLEDAQDVRLPAEVDDEQITPNGILPQPLGQTPLIAGFNIVTNLFKTLNDVLVFQRKKLPENVDGIMVDMQVMDLFRDRTVRACSEVAEPLRLKRAFNSRAVSPAIDWQAKLHARFVDYFHTATADQKPMNSFAVMQGNILVTQHVVRMVILQVRNTLQQRLSLYTHIPPHLAQSEQAEDLACDLLDGLNSLPIECVAINGPSLVQKVRFVGIQLMESSPDASSSSRAQKLLMQFLSVLSVIEGMYSFGRDISAE